MIYKSVFLCGLFTTAVLGTSISTGTSNTNYTMTDILLSTPPTTGYQQMESKIHKFSSNNWIFERHVNEHDMVKPIFVLKHSMEEVKMLEGHLLDISNPKSENFGQWLNRKEVTEMITPEDESVDLVVSYLKSFGVEDIQVNRDRDLIVTSMSAQVAERVLSTEFGVFRSKVQKNIGITRITKPYYLPDDIAERVALVDDILRFPAIQKPQVTFNSKSGTDSEFDSCGTSCTGMTTPDVLSSAYGFDFLTKATTGNTVAVAEFQYQYYDNTDLTNFANSCGVTVSVSETIGGNQEKVCTDTNGCVEALLDIEYIGAITNPIPLTVIYSADYSILGWINQVLEMADPPLVHSVSYGNDEVQQTSTEYMEVVNQQFIKAGNLGLSILFAAGDQGVWGRTGAGPTQTFHPDFPASSPYVTAVGGLNFATKSVIGEESAWDCGGGGFSNTFTQPSWQADVVNAYLAEATAQGVLPSSSLFNSAGRAYPDVSALGGGTNPYCVSYSGGTFGGVYGTSAACPVVAGIFSQLNDERLAAGKSSLGWLNQIIYDNPDCFSDVNDGSLNNCYTGYTGFAALDGWDPATGFGSPIYSCLSAAVADI